MFRDELDIATAPTRHLHAYQHIGNAKSVVDEAGAGAPVLERPAHRGVDQVPVLLEEVRPLAGDRISPADERISYLINVAMIKERPQAPGDVLLTAAIELTQLLRGEEPQRSEMGEQSYIPRGDLDPPRRGGSDSPLRPRCRNGLCFHSPILPPTNNRQF